MRNCVALTAKAISAGLIPERPTVVVIDEPKQAAISTVSISVPGPSWCSQPTATLKGSSCGLVDTHIAKNFQSEVVQRTGAEGNSAPRRSGALNCMATLERAPMLRQHSVCTRAV